MGAAAEAASRAARSRAMCCYWKTCAFTPKKRRTIPPFARALARLGDVYVDDAFGSAHRAHASTEGVTHDLPAYAGLLMERELDALGGLLSGAQRPFVVVLGGAKISDKIAVIESLMSKVDGFCIGGGMANTFLLAQNYAVGKSLVERDAKATAQDLLARTSTRRVGFHVPTDAIVSTQDAKALLGGAQRPKHALSP